LRKKKWVVTGVTREEDDELRKKLSFRLSGNQDSGRCARMDERRTI